ncbi:MAG: 50S ribosomal protein L28 [Sandaracinaceae bacterium]
MAYRCSICGKGAQAAHNVSHSNRKSRKWQKPNLQSVRAVVEGRSQRIQACTRCIRTGKVIKAA